MVCGAQYVADGLSADFRIDPVRHLLSASACLFKNNFQIGLRVRGNRQYWVSSLDPLLAYRYRDTMISLGATNFFSVWECALYTEPFRNVRASAVVTFPVREKVPNIAFGFCLKPIRGIETRLRVDSNGVMSASYQTMLNKNITLSSTLITQVSSFLDKALFNVSMDIRL